MSKLEDIQKDLAANRLERASLRRSLQVTEERIQELEMQQDLMEQAIAVVGNTMDSRASRLGQNAVDRSLRLPGTGQAA